jgi:hypothetical protein
MSTVGKLFPLLWFLAFLSPVAAIFFAMRFYVLHCRRRPQPDRRFPLVAYVLVLLVCTIVAFPFGLSFGISVACPGFGNLCGLFGFFVTGPFASSLAMFLVSALILFVPADEAAPISAGQAPIYATTRWYRRLWHGQYSLACSFWGFFILGTFVGVIIWMSPIFLFVPAAFFLRPVFLLGYQIAAGVGVWRSADALSATRGGHASVTYTDSMKIIAAKTVVVLSGGIEGILLFRTLRSLASYSHL